ncbi:MAG: PspC domain-containing protein [Candidatus Pacebacteria bacterium]|nr:PspC domain-containing protein [Candidatus Paceibacterota bacterium]
MKKLYKSKNNKIFSGVIGGIGEYFNVDPTILRLIWILILFGTGFFPGLAIYIIAAMIVPEHSKNNDKN